jgi:putative zinc finger/helix-turn-helix YgiT family protein
MDTTLCPSCMNQVRPSVVERREILPVRGEEVEVAAQVAVCPECGEDISVEELDNKTLRTAFDEYRRRRNLLTPVEIAAIREKYGLGQRAFSLLLGWGEITLHRYESGSLQDAAHDIQLRLASDPGNVRTLLAAHGDRLSASQKVKAQTRLEQLSVGPAEPLADSCFDGETVMDPADEFTGYRPFDRAKLVEMVLFFANRPKMFRTKLNKMLFYADFLHCKHWTLSVSGARYLAFQHGPVPQHYGWLTEALEESGELRAEEWTNGEVSGDVFTASRTPELTVFSESEHRVLRYVGERFEEVTSARLSALSHAEKAFVETAQKQPISYRWAKDLSESLPE